MKEISISAFNPFFETLQSEWALLTGGNPNSFNPMTISWGNIGVLWNKNIVSVFVRPTRHTFSFLEANKFFSLSFFENDHKEALKICGKMSGREGDKAKAANLTPLVVAKEFVSYEQACMCLCLEKIYSDDFHPEKFLSDTIEQAYPNKDYHRIFVGEIKSIFKKT